MNDSDSQRAVIEQVQAEFDREQRLLRLEKRVSLGLVALLALGAIELAVAARTFLLHRVTASSVIANSVTAGEFTLVDREGKKRGSLELSGGWPSLVLLGEDGQRLVEVSIARDGPRVSLENPTAGTSVSLGTELGLTMAHGPGANSSFEKLKRIVADKASPPSGVGPSTFSVGFSSFADATGATVYSPRLRLGSRRTEGPESSATLSIDPDGPHLELRDGAGNIHRQP